MKLISCLYGLLLIVVANAQTGTTDLKVDTSRLTFHRIKDSTAIGKPDGQPVSKEIGISGGTITSSDERVQLIFPQGALTINTLISIQPSENLAPNGVGKSYRFEPSGIQFKQPVKIIFRYSDEEAEICPPEWKSLGIQDEKGKWTFLDYEEVDSVSKQLVGRIHHFSFATIVDQIALVPDRSKIAVTESVGIVMVDILRSDATMIPPFSAALVSRSEPVIWYANTKVNGDDINGRITVDSERLGQERLFVATYHAPKILPEENEVTISAEIYKRTKDGLVLRKRVKTNIEVYDRYHLQVIHESTVRGGMGSKILDSAGFDIYIYPYSIELNNPNNYLPIVLKQGRRKQFREKIIVDGAEGTVHINDRITNQKRSKDYPPVIYFEFTPDKVMICQFQHGVKGMWSEPEPLFQNSLPKGLQFIANGKIQTYTLPDHHGGTYKLVVRPIRITPPTP
jgi:hypothetical protein